MQLNGLMEYRYLYNMSCCMTSNDAYGITKLHMGRLSLANLRFELASARCWLMTKNAMFGSENIIPQQLNVNR